MIHALYWLAICGAFLAGAWWASRQRDDADPMAEVEHWGMQ